MASVAEMARGIIAGAAIAGLIAFAIAFLSMVALFGINDAAMKISPDHYRRVVTALNVALCIVSALAGRHRAVST